MFLSEEVILQKKKLISSYFVCEKTNIERTSV